MPRKTQPKPSPSTLHAHKTTRAVHVLCAMGMSAPVVTETLYGLCVQPDDPAQAPVQVRELHIVTTHDGRAKGEEALRKAIERMGQHYPDALPRLPSSQHIHLHVPNGPDGKPLRDIDDPKSNAAFSDELLRHVRRLTRDGMPPLHASLAGGRKTMSYITGQLMGLLAREDDRLSHVLASANAESCKDFFYPLPAELPEEERILTRNHSTQQFDASQEKVLLHEVPFVRLRRILPAEALAQADDDFQTLIRVAQEQVTPPLEVHLYPGLDAKARVRVGEHRAKLSPLQGALYALLAQAAKDGREVRVEDLANPHREDPNARPQDHEELEHLYESVFTRNAQGHPAGQRGPETDLFSNPCEENVANFKPNLSKLSKALKKLPKLYHPAKGSKPGAWTLALSPDQIIIHRSKPA